MRSYLTKNCPIKRGKTKHRTMNSDSKTNNFDQFYQSIYPNNWSELKESLLEQERQMIRSCFGATPPKSSNYIAGQPLFDKSLGELVQSKNQQGLRQYYVMDPASYFCAQFLRAAPGESILDMCAAPGGKTLIILENLGKTGELWANEISKQRRERLTQVIKDYVPMENRPQVFVKGKDGLKYGLDFPKKFDRVLVDAPCSSERHVLKKPNELEKWGPKRTKKLAGIQYGLLCSAALACKPGGTIVYSTCSLSPLENDGVVEKFLKKKSEQVELVIEKHEYFKSTKYGLISLPLDFNIGPIYMTKFLKKTESNLE